MNYTTELTGALQVIAENVDSTQFDDIIEGASLIMSSYENISMDEAIQASAAALYNEDAISDNTYAVTSTVLDEFANTVPATYNDVIGVLAESMTQDQFDQFMSEAVGNQLAIVNENKVTQALNPVYNFKTAKNQAATYHAGKPWVKQLRKDYLSARHDMNSAGRSAIGHGALGAAETIAGAGALALGGRAIYNAKKHGDAAKDFKAIGNAAKNAANAGREKLTDVKDAAKAKLEARRATKAADGDQEPAPTTTKKEPIIHIPNHMNNSASRGAKVKNSANKAKSKAKTKQNNKGLFR